jgi:Sulfotransferase family
MLGFPRSGTTLVQQILQSHPQIHTLDEVDPAMGALRDHFAGTPARYPECLELLSDADWQELRGTYFRTVDALGLPAHEVLVDKLPLNLVRVDYLARLFPGARLLVSVRDPRDVVLSNYFQDFVPNPAMLQFTDLQASARTYAAAMRLWLDRRTTLRLPWREQRYEALTVDLEGEAHAMLAFLGVEWDPAVLAHHARAGDQRISTPSRYDVSRPVYGEAVGRWRDFERHLAPILPTLAPFVNAFGY